MHSRCTIIQPFTGLIMPQTCFAEVHLAPFQRQGCEVLVVGGFTSYLLVTCVMWLASW